MQVHRDIAHLPYFKNAVITIGTFDGVHTGHLQIIQQLHKEAELVNGETVIVTFDPHPRMIVHVKEGEKSSIQLLNTLPEKIALLAGQKIDHLVIVPFTLEFSEQNALKYIQDFLVQKFHPHSIVIGYDHRFGNKRQGDYKLLESYQSVFKYTVREIPEHVLHHITISSTRIRHALAEGDTETANEYLGYDYFFSGKVVEGDRVGRTIGYPTANIEVAGSSKLIPANGVYAVEVSLPGEHAANLLKGMMNIGVRPTVGGTKKIIEVHIFDFNQNIYGRDIKVFVKHFLRKEKKFEGLAALQAQLAQDKITALQLLTD
jgi:riboflavin kinase/FMN adenylyltransferase